MNTPQKAQNFIAGNWQDAFSKKTFNKLNPHNGTIIATVSRANEADVQAAVEAAKASQREWANTPGVRRGEILFEVAERLKNQKEAIAGIVSLETGKSPKDALGEVKSAIQQCYFMAAEGQRLFGRTTTSATAHRFPSVIREPVGIAGLIISANTPIANVAWKVCPALICGNSAVLKPSEDAPLTANAFATLTQEAGLPAGVLNIVHGFGEEAGVPLVNHHDLGVISFTGSTEVGRTIARTVGGRLAKACLELGGKNPLVICDDADIENAIRWAILSSFSNAGQRCAASSRILIFESIYEVFKKKLIEAAGRLKVGPTDDEDFGPVINADHMTMILSSIENAAKRGAKILTGGIRLQGPRYQNGFYIAPTILDGVGRDDELSRTELFGPVTVLYQVRDLRDALEFANHNPYGLTAAVHTRNFSRAVHFSRSVQSGMVVINAGTYGSEPHMPFGGVKHSGNGVREPGPEALDLYTNLKTIYEVVDPEQAQ